MTDLIALQSARENAAHAARQAARCALVGPCLGAVAAALGQLLAGLARGGAGRTHVSVGALRGLDPVDLAALALAVCVDGVARAEALARLAERAGERVEMLKAARSTRWSRARRARIGATLVNAVLIGAGDV
ncbi:MAG: hypothetical protein ACT60Q_06995, partial [Ferrovibrionaceae bacterium]